MVDRSEIFRELGLLPVYRLRDEPEPEVAPQRVAETTASAAQAVVAVEEVAAAANMVPESRQLPAAGPMRSPERRPAMPRPSVEPPAPPQRQDDTGQPLAERRALVARMEWDELEASIRQCTACGLCRTRTQAVPGVGDQQAEWMIVGEAPGADEDRLGEPFVGQAGKLLDAMLAAIGLQRGRNERGGVYIANVLKCRPPGNRNPNPPEVEQCRPYLERQVELVRPKVIVALGRFAALTLLNTDASIASLRGRVHQYQGVPLVITYHPAYLLRNLPDKAKAWEDWCLARATMSSLQQA